ncbi:SNF2 family N-terminal domain-containing protein [Lophiotrema nucula]|uniref:DNA helicase n=1 Tax=Lophiotrema nucula TaxID=690887 RepID=A0A6A5YZ42_9PLEO|nr:SNF2 family N-terminal domain-containing protein [Lophiotrema nucula]
MEVAEIEGGTSDSIPNTTSDAPHELDDAAATHDAQPDEENNTVAVKSEEELPARSEDDDGATQRPLKRRKLGDLTPRRSSSRAFSPPWKSFAVDGPTTIIADGVRKSARVNKDAPAPEPAKRSTRHAAKATQTNGNSKNGSKKNSFRSVSGPATTSKTKQEPSHAKKASAASVKSPAQGSRKSERQRKPSATAAAFSSPVVQNGSPDKKKPGRPRKSTQTSDVISTDLYSTPVAQHTYSYDQTYDYQTSPDDSNPTGPGPRLRLRLRRPDPPNRHPGHAPHAAKFSTFAEWLQNDDPLEGEETQRITRDKAQEEAERRLQIVEAAERGALSLARCSIFAPQPAEEPPPQYNHWDHIVAHALHFNKLLREESSYHKRIAKTLAREAVDYWKNKYKRKTQEEIDEEERERAVIRYKQLVKDVKDSWALVKGEIDKERVARWEEEQLQLGHKAMDNMFNQAKEILGRGMVDSASSFVSDDRGSESEAEHDFGSGSSGASHAQEDEDEIMSSDSGSEEEAAENDEDANLTAEQLQAKYGQLPDVPVGSSDVEESEHGANEGQDEDGNDEERTPEPSPDPELEMQDADVLPPNPFDHANGFHEFDTPDDDQPDSGIDPATIELDQVNDALLDSDDDGMASQSGSEEWPSDEDSEGSEEDEVPSSSDGSDEEDDVGMMGFLAPSEMKKMKEAAKAVVDEQQDEEEAPITNGVNGYHDDEEDIKGPVNGTAKPEPEIEVDPTNGDGDVDAQKKPAIDITESEAVDDIATGKPISRSRSRQNSEPPRTEIPSLLRGTLREYQHGGLDWLANLYDTDTNGILADEMGLGKTIQTIALLAYVAVYRQIWGPHLVVVPTSVMLNWEMEFKKWCPGFKILTYYGDIAERKRKRSGWRTTGPDMYNVVITSYQLILQDAAAFKMRPWKYLILDEAHNIKNFKSQRWQTMLNLRTEKRLLLTGTPLQNNIDELWSLLYFLMPAGFAGEGRIAGLEEFTMALKNPTSQILEQGRQQLDAEAQKIVKKLHEVLRPYLLRRLKADVEKQMPAKYEHVVYCKLSKRQRQLYDGFMGRATTKAILSSGNYMSIINCLMSLRKVCNHPDLFETRAIVTSMAMPKSVAAAYEIKDLLIRKRLHEGMEDQKVNLEALNLVFARREQTSMLHARRSQRIRATRPLQDLIERQTRRLNSSSAGTSASSLQSVLSVMADRENVAVRDHLQNCLKLTRARTQFLPIYGKGLINRLTLNYQNYAFGGQLEGPEKKPVYVPAYNPAPTTPYGMPAPIIRHPMPPEKVEREPGKRGQLGFRAPRNPLIASEWYQRQISYFQEMIPTVEQRAATLEPIVTRFTCATPAVAAEELATLTLSAPGVKQIRSSELVRRKDPFHESRIRQSIAFPDKRLLQYDCGKLQRLAVLLRDLQAGGHRALIFTQMTKVLDILEQFLNIHGHRYLRLDGATKVEQRQLLTDRFNSDPKILCFILSSRSGGLGINLTGADTVIFYDLDWNPAMDKQCQDRSHRIGQTRDVHIYKFVSEYTIEANILRKSNQKRLLDDVIIQKGDFTTDYFNKVTWKDALDNEPVDEAGAAMDRVLGEKAGLLGDAHVMQTVEDTEDRAAATVAQKEIVDEIHDDQVDFNESSAATPANGLTRATSEAVEQARKNAAIELRHVDEYMLSLFREEYGKEPYKPPTDRQKRHRKGHDPHRTGRRRH